PAQQSASVVPPREPYLACVVDRPTARDVDMPRFSLSLDEGVTVLANEEVASGRRSDLSSRGNGHPLLAPLLQLEAGHLEHRVSREAVFESSPRRRTGTQPKWVDRGQGVADVSVECKASVGRTWVWADVLA